MLEVTVNLVRSPVYLPGHIVECLITFSIPPVRLHERSENNSDALEGLAWASAQIHCQCSTNSEVILPVSHSLPVEQLPVANTETSFATSRGESGRTIFSTRPRILFCDLRLATGENKSYLYSEVLPSEAPPSYHGKAAKYCYFITIKMQRVNCPIKLLQVPLRVLVINDLLESSARGHSEDLTRSNPFLEIQSRETTLDMGVHLLQNVTARRHRYFYNITINRERVVRICVLKHKYKLGEDIAVKLDFTEATVKCIKFTVVLQSEEEIASGCQRWGQQSVAVAFYSRHQEWSFDMKKSKAILPVPMYITPTFQTELVTLRWSLCFEFVTIATPSASYLAQERNVCLGDLDTETVVWELPIKIHSSTPMHVAHVLEPRLKFGMVI